MRRSLNQPTEEPEYASLEAFCEYLLDDEKDSYTVLDLHKLSVQTGLSKSEIRNEMENFGFRLIDPRQTDAYKNINTPFRTLSSNPHDRWCGAENATHGGAGINPSTGGADTMLRRNGGMTWNPNDPRCLKR